MKKISSLLILILLIPFVPAFADQGGEEFPQQQEEQNVAQEQEQQTLNEIPKSSPSPVQPAQIPQAGLLNMDSAANKSRITDLERRFSDMERSFRFLQDEVRSLERSVDDLKRRRD